MWTHGADAVSRDRVFLEKLEKRRPPTSPTWCGISPLGREDYRYAVYRKRDYVLLPLSTAGGMASPPRARSACPNARASWKRSSGLGATAREMIFFHAGGMTTLCTP